MGNSVFINCPYDEQYKDFFKLLVFLCKYFNHDVEFASSDLSSQLRLNKIIELIKKTKIGIHDISRFYNQDGTKPRFNMPFELGMDYMYANLCDIDKKILVLDGKQNDYHDILSDLVGSDIKAHDNDENKLIEIVRHFFVGTDKYKSVDTVDRILKLYKLSFKTWLHDNLAKHGFDNDIIEMVEFERKVDLYFSSNNINRPQ